VIKVLHVFGKMDRGGAELRTVDLMPILWDKGVRFDFCTLLNGSGQLDARIRHIGGEVFPCPLRPGVFTFGRRFTKVLKTSNCDIVHCHVHYFSGYLVHLAHRVGIKGRIVHFRTTDDGKPLTLTRKVYHNTMKKMVDKHATDILAVSNCAMEFTWGKNWQRDVRAKVIYNGIDLSYFRKPVDRASVLQEIGIDGDSKVFIYVANMVPPKGHDILLEAVPKVLAEDSKTHFLLAGDGELRPELQLRAKELGIDKNVHFLGVREDVPTLLRASDCFVFPSLREGLPGAVLEAVAANMRIVATALPGVEEIAKYTDLISFVPLGDKEALGEKLLQITKNPGELSSVERQFPSEFDLRCCAGRLFELYCR